MSTGVSSSKPTALLETKPKRVRQKSFEQYLKLSLEENAYNFLNESLRQYRKTSRNLNAWPFALLHIVQALELMLKQVLQAVHPILIYADIDQRKSNRNTVSLEQALHRLENLGVPIEEKERINIRRAALRRNLVVHYEVEFNRLEWKKIYAQLFEFVHFFHHKHLKTEIHSHITRENWSVEARLMRFFEENFVVYNGIEMAKESPKDILDAQRIIGFSDGNQSHLRIKYGDELSCTASFIGNPCPDCGVVQGQYHAEGCDMEECPDCHGQLLGCPCLHDFDLIVGKPGEV